MQCTFYCVGDVQNRSGDSFCRTLGQTGVVAQQCLPAGSAARANAASPGCLLCLIQVNTGEHEHLLATLLERLAGHQQQCSTQMDPRGAAFAFHHNAPAEQVGALP